jgi:hypothetical protein
MMSQAVIGRPTASFALAASLALVGIVPLPSGELRAWRQSLRTLEPNRADRVSSAASYYEGLINVGVDGNRNELALRLLGKPPGWVSFHDVNATRYLSDDLLQFELLPGLEKSVMGQSFTTNALGLRDREYGAAKAPDVFRIALLGASMDMGWGVTTDETYENRFEDWLNAYAVRHGIRRRFEVMNFSMAAYSPLHRLEAFRRKAEALRPDLVLYSATLLDPRLLEIHVRGLLRDGIELGPYRSLARVLADEGIPPPAANRCAEPGTASDKDALKARLHPALWPLIDATLGHLADECRSRGLPLYCLIVPRAGDADLPEARVADVARYVAISAHHAIPVVDLTAAFDDEDPASVEIAAWDDHPNARGHKLLFQALAGMLVRDPRFYSDVFGIEPSPDGTPSRVGGGPDGTEDGTRRGNTPP